MLELGDRGGRAAPPPGANVPPELREMVNPDVTQGSIQSTICRRGWTRTVRPSAEVTGAIKCELVAKAGGAMRDYELDHIVPLDLGGAPLNRRNLRLQLWPEARIKDALEVELSKAVCANVVALSEAQREIATDWRAACREWIGPQGCGQ